MLAAAALVRRARALALPIRDRFLEVRHNPPALPFTWAAVALLIGFAVAAYIWLDAGWRRDAWWRSEIARSSAEVRAILREQGRTIIAGDENLVADLKREKDNVEAELEELRRARESMPLSEACRLCRVPAERVRRGLQ
jgi:hypothetical protein